MNIIPEEPEIYLELPRPTPSLQSLLNSRQFYMYVQAHTSQLLGSPRVSNIRKPQHAQKSLSKTLAASSVASRKPFIYFGIGVGVLAITKLVKALSSKS